VVAFGLVLVMSGAGTHARADVVDEAFARGHQAATTGDWSAAVGAFAEAEDLLPGRSAVLSYNLGTAYAQLGDYGPATYHFRRALQPEAGPTADVAEAAQRNLGIVRRRVELAATAAGARFDQPDTGWSPMLAALRGRAVGWMALGSGWLGLALWWWGRWWRQRHGAHERGSESGRVSGAGVAGSLVVMLLAVFVVVGGLHGFAVRAEQNAPPAIILDVQAVVRDAPGMHRTRVFTVQGGSQVRIVDRTRGWCQIRLSDGLEGWIPERALGEISGRPPRWVRGPQTRSPAGVSP
jgi:hypothetical protein